MVGVLWCCLWDSIVDANPFVSVEICTHQVFQHISSLLNQSYKWTGCFCIIGILFDVLDHEDDFLTHWGTLYSCAAVIKETGLIFFNSLGDSILEDFTGSGIFEWEDSLDHFVTVVELGFGEVIFIPGMKKMCTSC